MTNETGGAGLDYVAGYTLAQLYLLSTHGDQTA